MFITQLAEPNTKETGKTTNSTDMEKKLGLMKQSIRESTRMGKSTEKASFCGKMIAAMTEISYRTTSTVWGSMFGTTEESTRESGRIIKWKAREFSPGSMEGATKVNTGMIKRKVLESSLSEMVESMKASGKMVNNTAEASSKRKTFLGKEFGKMGNELDGQISPKRMTRVFSELLGSDFVY